MAEPDRAWADERCILAAGNNADWVRTVLAAHGVRFRRERAGLQALDPPPPYYSNLVALTPTDTAHQLEMLAALERRVAEGSLAGGVSVKDSFCTLDLSARSYRLLFDAQWIWAEAEAFDAVSAEGWQRIDSSAALDAWEQDWKRLGSPTDRRIFLPSLLDRPEIAFFGRRDGDRYAAGCIANRSEACVGLSNVFGETVDAQLFAVAARLTADFGEGRTVVGYEASDTLDAALGCGFRAVGGLRVWVSST